MCTFTKSIHMRINILVADELMQEARRLSGLKTKKDVIEKALEAFIRLHRQIEIRKLRGKVQWEGNLDEMRSWQ